MGIMFLTRLSARASGCLQNLRQPIYNVRIIVE